MNNWDFMIWTVIVGLGIGTYLIRFSFLGLIGGRELPQWLVRHLRYVAVGVIPALVTPLVVWPQATGGEPDPIRMTAAVGAFVIGIIFNSVLAAIIAGMSLLYVLQYLMG